LAEVNLGVQASRPQILIDLGSIPGGRTSATYRVSIHAGKSQGVITLVKIVREFVRVG
jgi:hypothetical protein